MVHDGTPIASQGPTNGAPLIAVFGVLHEQGPVRRRSRVFACAHRSGRTTAGRLTTRPTLKAAAGTGCRTASTTNGFLTPAVLAPTSSEGPCLPKSVSPGVPRFGFVHPRRLFGRVDAPQVLIVLSYLALLHPHAWNPLRGACQCICWSTSLFGLRLPQRNGGLDHIEFLFYAASMLVFEASRAQPLEAGSSAPGQRVRAGSEGEAVTDLIEGPASGTNGLVKEQGSALNSREEESTAEPPSPHKAELVVKAGSERSLAPLWRGRLSSSIPCEIRIFVETPDSRNGIEPDVASDSGSSVAAFGERIVNQLKLSTWLPGALFAVSIAALLQLRSVRVISTFNVVQAMNPIRLVVLVVPLLAIAVVLINAFSFEAIRTLEGYWRKRGIMALVRTLMIQKHVRRKKVIAEWRHRATEKAFYATKSCMLNRGIPAPIVNAFEAQILGNEPPLLSDEDGRRFSRMDWRSLCDPWHLARIDNLLNEEITYPATSRILPTRLGNLLRATEDQLQNTGGDLQAFVLQRYAMAPRRVQMQHDQFRNRLGLCCSLVFVNATLAALTPFILLGSAIGIASTAIITGSFAALGVASYRAAVASAAGYCITLKQMDEAPRAS